MRYVIGIDEVGRGSLAGPVVVCAAAVPRELRIMNYELGKLRDSKRLTVIQRERWNEYIRRHPKISFALARVYPRGIEKMNISNAANLAASRAYTRLAAKSQVSRVRSQVFLDGGLYLGNRKRQTALLHQGLGGQANGKWNAQTVVRGDEKFTAIKLASIIAKVSRDKFMTRLAKKHPHYGFEIHKGYGTKAHLAAILEYGPSEAHRATFLKFLG